MKNKAQKLLLYRGFIQSAVRNLRAIGVKRVSVERILHLDLTVLLYPGMRESAEESDTDLGMDNSWSLFYHEVYTFIDIH